MSLYIDDMLILGANPKRVQELVEQIAALWEIRDLGDVGAILGIRIIRNHEKRTISINQGLYIDKLIERFRLDDAKPMSLPTSDRNVLVRGHSEEPQADQHLYQEGIGGLSWVAKGTWIDIAYVVRQLSQYCAQPMTRHWNTVLRILRYLQGTRDYTVVYSWDTQGLEAGLLGYSDVGYAGDIEDRYSTTGYLFLLNRGLISWTSTKQRCVATSTAELEYIALAEAGKQS